MAHVRFCARRGPGGLLCRVARRAGVRQIDEENYSGRWVPVVRVEDPEALLKKVESLGGLVWIKPGEKIRNEYTTLICDNNGALLILQKWTFPDDGEED